MIEVIIRVFPDSIKKRAIVFREIESEGRKYQEVLAANGKWRMKSEYESLFDDEKHHIMED